MARDRDDLTFRSGTDDCAAWLYRPDAQAGDVPRDVPCVVMSHGFSLTRHDGLEAYAEALASAGAAVLVFDHRYLGDSGGPRRQRFRASEQAADVRAAIATARSLDGVDPERVILWGFSFSGGTAVNVAAGDARLAGVMLVAPFLDGRARVVDTLRRTPWVAARIMLAAVRDLLGRHHTIPVTGPPGSLAAMAFDGEESGFTAAAGAGSPWRNEISPGVFASVATHRPVRRAGELALPVWVSLGERDLSVSNAAVERLAADAPRAELHRYDVDHFEPCFGSGQQRIAADQVAWFTQTFAG